MGREAEDPTCLQPVLCCGDVLEVQGHAQDQQSPQAEKVWDTNKALEWWCSPPCHSTGPRRPLERDVRTESPCPSPTCPHLSCARAQTIPLIIPGSFSQVIPKANHSLCWAPPSHCLHLSTKH